MGGRCPINLAHHDPSRPISLHRRQKDLEDQRETDDPKDPENPAGLGKWEVSLAADLIALGPIAPATINRVAIDRVVISLAVPV